MLPPGAIGSTTWPGTSKLTEECGELLQVLGKIAAYPGGEHPDGTDIVARLHDELADVMAAAEYVIDANRLDAVKIHERIRDKAARFWGWHRAERTSGQ